MYNIPKGFNRDEYEIIHKELDRNIDWCYYSDDEDGTTYIRFDESQSDSKSNRKSSIYSRPPEKVVKECKTKILEKRENEINKIEEVIDFSKSDPQTILLTKLVLQCYKDGVSKSDFQDKAIEMIENGKAGKMLGLSKKTRRMIEKNFKIKNKKR